MAKSLNSLEPTTGASKHHPSSFRHAQSPQLKSQIVFSGNGKTKQEFRLEADINIIMARYQQTGVIDFVSKHQPRYQDVTGLDYYEAMLTVSESRSMFQDLPAQLRERFKNDPGQFLDYVQDPDNTEEMRELGLLKASPKPAEAPAATKPPSPTNSSPPTAQAPPAAAPEAGLPASKS